MKKTYFLFCFLFFFYSICQAETYTVTTDYYPLKTGNVWLYSESSSDGSEVYADKVIKLEDGKYAVGSISPGCMDTEGSWFSWDDTGLKMYKDRDCEDSELYETIYNNPVTLLYKNMELNHTYTISGDNYIVHVTLLSYNDTITVPAGTFDNCLRVEVASDIADESGTCNLWYAKGVGLVKEQCISDGEEEKTELINAIIDGKIIGELSSSGIPSMLAMATYSANGCVLTAKNIVISNNIYSAYFKFNLDTLNFDFYDSNIGAPQAQNIQCSIEGLDFGNAVIANFIDKVKKTPEIYLKIKINDAIYKVAYFFNVDTLNWEFGFVVE